MAFVGDRRMRRAVGAVAVVAAVAGAAGCAEDVGRPPGTDIGEGVDVNADGLAAVLGHTYVPDENDTPYTETSAWTLDTDGTFTAVPGLDLGGPADTTPIGVDDAGTVVGYTALEYPGSAIRAFVWDAANGTRPLVPEGHESFRPAAMNDEGLVVGSVVERATFSQHAVLWDRTTGTALVFPDRPGRQLAVPLDINDDGVVVGWTAYENQDTSEATVWRPPLYEPEVLDQSLMQGSQATDIDDDGTIVGHSFHRGADFQTGMRWAGPSGSQELLDDFLPTDIDQGVMVGHDPAVSTPALVWPAGADGAKPLGTVKGQPTYARAIDGDHIVGSVATGGDPPFTTGNVARFIAVP
jgi:uncharacterized membrane protein